MQSGKLRKTHIEIIWQSCENEWEDEQLDEQEQEQEDESRL